MESYRSRANIDFELFYINLCENGSSRELLKSILNKGIGRIFVQANPFKNIRDWNLGDDFVVGDGLKAALTGLPDKPQENWNFRRKIHLEIFLVYFFETFNEDDWNSTWYVTTRRKLKTDFIFRYFVKNKRKCWIHVLVRRKLSQQTFFYKKIVMKNFPVYTWGISHII